MKDHGVMEHHSLHTMKKLAELRLKRSATLLMAVAVLFTMSYVLISPASTIDAEEAMEQGGIDVPHAEDQVAAEKGHPAEESAEKETTEEKNTESSEETGGEKKTKKSEPAEKIATLSYDDKGYMLRVENAELNPDTSLKVKEIRGDSDEEKERKAYDYYFQETVKALQKKEGEKKVADLSMAMFYDITLNVEGKEIHPDQSMDVTVAYDKAIALEDQRNLRVVHFREDPDTGEVKAEVLSRKHVELALNKKGAMKETTFRADSFSVYAVVYTEEAGPEEAENVSDKPDSKAAGEAADKASGEEKAADEKIAEEKVVGTYTAGIPVGGYVSLTSLVKKLGIEKSDPEGFVQKIEKVRFSEPELLWVGRTDMDTTVEMLKLANGVEQVYPADMTEKQITKLNKTAVRAGDWALISLHPIAGEARLTITLKSGEAYRVLMKNAQKDTVLTAKDKSYEITLVCDEEAEIPAGAQLKVREIKAKENAYKNYFTKAAEAADADFSGKKAKQKYGRFFDITIMDGNKAIEPKSGVALNIKLADAPDSDGVEPAVVHFGKKGPEVLDTYSDDVEDVRFDAESFSVYGVITVPGEPRSEEDLDGRTFRISQNGRYMTSTVNHPSENTSRFGNTTQESGAAVWKFQSAGTSGQYYIFTQDSEGRKSYINVHSHGSGSGDASLSEDPQAFTVSRSGNGYIISAESNGRTYNLRELSQGQGFSGDPNSSNDSVLNLSFTQNTIQGSVNNPRQYILMTEYEGKYYVILNDGTLVENEGPILDEVKITSPMVWQYNGQNLYHKAKETGFDGCNLASDYFYRYLDPNVDRAYTEEDYDSTTGHLGSEQTEYFIDSRPLMDQMKITYAGNKIRSQSDASNYIGISESRKGLKIVGKQSAENAAKIYFVEMTEQGNLVNNQNLVDNTYHTVNHIDISIVGHAAFTVPLAFGTYYYKDDNGQIQKLIVNRENQLELEIAQDVPVTREDIKKADVTAFRMGDNGEHIDLDNVFYITGFSGNAENGTSTNQTRIEGVFKVADVPPMQSGDWGGYWDNNGWHSVPNEQTLQNRLDNKIYYTVSTTKKVSFDFTYNNYKLYDSRAGAEAGAENGVSRGSATVTLAQTFNYWDPKNECPVLDKSNGGSWSRGEINYGWNEKTGSGMDFALSTIDKSAYGVQAIEITKYIQDKEGNAITPLNDVNNVFHVYHSENASENDVQGMDVDEYSGGQAGYDYDNNGYNFVHDKNITVSDGGMGTIYDYDVDGGMIYIEEDSSEKNLPKSIEDVNGKHWNYMGTRLETEYVWRDDGIEYRRHVSKSYTDRSEAMRSIPDILGNYKDINNVDRYNGFLEFYVYNIYDAEPIDVAVKKNWKHENGSDAHPIDDASLTLTLGRYKLVEDEENPVSGNLVIDHSISIGQDNENGSYYATYKVKQGNKVYRSASYALDRGNLHPTMNLTGLPAGEYTLEITESTNGFNSSTQMDGQAVTKKTISITTGHQTTVNVSTSLNRNEAPKMVAVHVNCWQSGNTYSPYKTLNYTFPAGEKLVFTMYRPAGAHRAFNLQYKDSFGRSSYTDVPWPSVENNNAYVYTDQVWEYPAALPEDSSEVTIDFRQNWDEQDFRIKAVELEKGSQQTGNDSSGSSGNTGSSGNNSNSGSTNNNSSGSGTGSNALSNTQEDENTSVSAVSSTGKVPESTVPGMKYVDDPDFSYTVKLGNGLWEDVVRGLDPVDREGHKYQYYIRTVDETGIPENTEVTIRTDSEGYVQTSDGDTVLKVTNTIPDEKPDITLKKVDDNGVPLPGASFKISKDGVALDPDDPYISIDSPDGILTLSGLEDGTYTIDEVRAPNGYWTIAGNISFVVDGKTITWMSTLPDGITFDDESYTFTVVNTPINNGELKVLKRWLDFYGNADTQTTGLTRVKLVQMAQNQAPKRIVRVMFYIKGNGEGGDNKPWNYDTLYTLQQQQTALGRGTATVKFHWNQYTHIPIDSISVTGPGSVSSTGNADEFLLTIPDTGNGNDTVIVRIDNGNWRVFEYGGGFIEDIKWPQANTPAEGYTATGGTKTIDLSSGNNWTQEFNYSGDGLLSDSSTTLPATYNGRECLYTIVEDPVPDGYSVFYSDNNVAGLGHNSSGTITAYNRKTTTDISLIKVDKSNHSVRLPDAEFTLNKLDTNQVGGRYQAGWEARTVRTDENGSAVFRDLPYGYYELKETEVPEGYVISDSDSFYFKLTTEGIVRIEKDESKYPNRWSSLGNDSMLTINKGTLTIGNEPGVALPATGGRGTIPFYILGVILLLGCGGLLAARRRAGSR